MTPDQSPERLEMLEQQIARIDARLGATTDPDERLALAQQRLVLFNEAALILRERNQALQQENMALASKVLGLLQERLMEDIDPEERTKILEDMKWAVGILGDSSRGVEG